MKSLYGQLSAYRKSGCYPFHMPGHKRNMGRNGFEDPFSFDITEIEGFDNLHHAQGILLEAQQRAAELYGARETYFLVNGSTAGILSAVSGCVPRGGRLLMARNCHKAVYHAAFLSDLDTVYVYPEKERVYGLNGGILPGEVERLLLETPGIGAVVITSPTYDGIVSDVRGIAAIVHRYGIPLIVDEAHGAHLKFHPYFPKSAVDQGADVVIQSVHKTLPALTQTALLHICGPYADAERIRRYLSVYQTSSPSYVLMASIDRCVELLAREEEDRRTGGKESGPLFEAFIERLSRFRSRAKSLSCLHLAGEEIAGTAGIYGLDRSKLVISGKAAGISGSGIQRILREKDRIELEMAAGSYALGISTVMDTGEGFLRLFKALKSLDGEILTGCAKRAETADNGALEASETEGEALIRPEKVRRLSEAELAAREERPLRETEGCVSAEYIYLYPPGIPIIAPGERISRELLWQLERYQKSGLTLEGMRDLSGERLLIIQENGGCA